MKDKKKENKKQDSEQEQRIELEYEVNILEDDDMISVKKVKASEKSFKHENTNYNIDNRNIHLSPTKTSYEPVLFYKKGNKDPLQFMSENKGIPSRALNLLWDKYLYSVIMTFDNPRINKIVVILLLANAVMFGIGLYLMYGR